jgi:hypothetical protein
MWLLILKGLSSNVKLSAVVKWPSEPIGADVRASKSSNFRQLIYVILFFEGFTYKHLHHLVKELKDDISTFRVMAYLFKHGADVLTMSGYIKEDSLEIVAYLEMIPPHGEILIYLKWW